MRESKFVGFFLPTQVIRDEGQMAKYFKREERDLLAHTYARCELA